MANQGNKTGNQGGQGDRDREGNIGQGGRDMNNPTGTSGRRGDTGDQNQGDAGNQTGGDRSRRQNADDDDSSLGTRNTNR